MSQLTLNLPDGFEKSVQLTASEFENQVRLMAALKMFELGKLSSGMAAELAGVSRAEFLEICARYEVPVADQDIEELQEELAQLSSWRD